MDEQKNVFFPATPIFDLKFFFGRKSELEKLLNLVKDPGQHIFVFGERGIGKTSLINIFSQKIKNVFLLKVSCYRRSNKFRGVMNDILTNLTIELDLEKIFEIKNPEKYIQKIIQQTDFSINSLVNLFKKLKKKLIIVIDEIDLYEKKKSNLQQLADFIKGVSDNCNLLSLIFVGIGNSINNLTFEHESLLRCLSEIHLDRMKNEQISDIIDNGLYLLNLRINPEVKKTIINYSKGFPYFTHMLAKYSIMDAIKLNYNMILINNLNVAVKKTIENSSENLKEQLYQLVENVKNKNYEKVLYSAILYEEHYQEDISENQLFKSNNLLFFTAKDLLKVTKHYYPELNLKSIQYCLNKLSQESYCPQVFIKKKNTFSTYFSFKNPLFQTFVLLHYFNLGKEKLKIYL